ncbi:MarR family transcriptional regulator [Streptomyces reniochalinae]|uniref:MarR family transcriptional regulator n=1 Tax=Streptomyces reniochalinae TaxID=2250578 RepID=A0A367F613_9ACTN|nr:MarR family transcriptional regulator [Streptomyces reniochalinae]
MRNGRAGHAHVWRAARHDATAKVCTYGDAGGVQTTQKTETGAYFVSAARGFALLAALAELEEEDPGAHRLGVIARRAGLSPSQANKLLAQAEQHGLVRRTGYGRYALSPHAAATGTTETDRTTRPTPAGPTARPAAASTAGPAARRAAAASARPSTGPAVRSTAGTARPPAAVPAVPVAPAVRRARALAAGGAKTPVTAPGPGPLTARERPGRTPAAGAAPARRALPGAGQPPVSTVPAR